MKKSIYLVLVIVALLFANALPVQAPGQGHGRGHSFHVGGLGGPGGGGGWGACGWGDAGST